jgi:hypothetical protein
MITQPSAHAAIARELVRIHRRRRQPVHPGYVAIVAKAHELGLPKRATTDITLLDRRLIMQRRPRQFAWLLHDVGSLLSIPEPNQRPLDYLYAAKRMFGQALPFWWDGSELVRAEHIDELMERMEVACADLERKARELL